MNRRLVASSSPSRFISELLVAAGFRLLSMTKIYINDKVLLKERKKSLSKGNPFFKKEEDDNQHTRTHAQENQGQVKKGAEIRRPT